MTGGGQPTQGGRRGVVRLAFAEWARQRAREGRLGGLTLAELAALVPCMSIRAPPERRILEYTVRDMVKAGELVRLGFVRGSCRLGRPFRVYAPPAPGDGTGQAEAQAVLAGVAASWGRGGTVPGTPADDL